MFCHVLFVIPAIITVTILVAKYFLLKTFAIQFKTFRSLTVAPHFLLRNHVVFLFVHRLWQKTCVTTFTTLWKRWWTVPYRVLNRKTLVYSFLKRFSEGFGVKWILCIDSLLLTFRIFPRTFVFHFGWNEFLIGTGAIEYFFEVFGFNETLFRLTPVCFDKGLLWLYFGLIILLNKKFLEQVMTLNRTLLFDLGRFSYLRKIILLLDVHIYLSNEIKYFLLIIFLLQTILFT